MVTVTAENLEADIVIIGGGASGLCAAVSAAEAGAKNIIVLEKASTTGGNGRVSVGFFAAESPPQKRLGLEVSKDEIFKRFMAFNHWKSDARLIRTWINKTGDIVAWLEGKGLDIRPERCEISQGEEHSRRWHTLWRGEGNPPGMVGKAIVEKLTGECQKLGIQIILGAAANHIITDKKRLCGVIASTKDREIKINTGSVIIGTGGFSRNKKLLKKYFPLYNENMFTHSLPQMTGDGLIMASEAGAAIDKSIVFAFFGPHHYSWNNHLTYFHRMPEAIRVNKKGARYATELTSSSFDFSNALTRQPEAISYTIFDSRIKHEIIDKNRPMGPFLEALATREDWLDVIEEDIKKEVENSRIKISDSWDDIAGFIGIKPEVIRATIEQYNSFCANGYDADFLKDKQFLWPLRTPPYYAVISTQGFDVSIGGIMINHRMEAINKKGDPVGGLYVIGNDAGCVHSCTYTGGAAAPGCDLSFALCSGFIAGENAYKYTRENKSKKSGE